MLFSTLCPLNIIPRCETNPNSAVGEVDENNDTAPSISFKRNGFDNSVKRSGSTVRSLFRNNTNAYNTLNKVMDNVMCKTPSGAIVCKVKVVILLAEASGLTEVASEDGKACNVTDCSLEIIDLLKNSKQGTARTTIPGSQDWSTRHNDDALHYEKNNVHSTVLHTLLGSNSTKAASTTEKPFEDYLQYFIFIEGNFIVL